MLYGRSHFEQTSVKYGHRAPKPVKVASNMPHIVALTSMTLGNRVQIMAPKKSLDAPQNLNKNFKTIMSYSQNGNIQIFTYAAIHDTFVSHF